LGDYGFRCKGGNLQQAKGFTGEAIDNLAEVGKYLAHALLP